VGIDTLAYILFLFSLLIIAWTLGSGEKDDTLKRSRRLESISAICGIIYLGATFILNICFPDIPYIYLSLLPFLAAGLLLFIGTGIAALIKRRKKMLLIEKERSIGNASGELQIEISADKNELSENSADETFTIDI